MCVCVRERERERQAGCVRRTVRELWEEALFEAMALRRLLRGGDV